MVIDLSNGSYSRVPTLGIISEVNGSLPEKNGYHFFLMFHVSDLPVCHKLFDFYFISEELMFREFWFVELLFMRLFMRLGLKNILCKE